MFIRFHSMHLNYDSNQLGPDPVGAESNGVFNRESEVYFGCGVTFGYFLQDGMGLLKIISSGMRVDGKTIIMDRLVANTISSRTKQSIVIESSKNFTISARDRSGRIENLMMIGESFRLSRMSLQLRLQVVTESNAWGTASK